MKRNSTEKNLEHTQFNNTKNTTSPIMFHTVITLNVAMGFT